MLRRMATNAAMAMLGLTAASLARLFLPGPSGDPLEEQARTAVLGPPEVEEPGPAVASPQNSPPVMGDSAVLPGSESGRPGAADTRTDRSHKREILGKYRRSESQGLADPGPDVAPEMPPTSAAAPAVHIMGPADAMLGDQIYLRAVVTGDARFYRWRVSPAVSGLIVMEDGRSAVFSNRNPGIYRFVVAVSGPGGVELDEAEIEVVDTAVPEPDPPAAEMPVPAAAAAAASVAVPQMSAAQRQAAFDQQIAGLVGRVASVNRVAESKIVAGCFRQVAEALQSGALPATREPIGAVLDQAQVALGVSGAAWRPFFVEFAAVTNDQRFAAPRDPGLLLSTASTLSRLK